MVRLSQLYSLHTQPYPNHGQPIPTIQIGNNLLPVVGLAMCQSETSQPVRRGSLMLIRQNTIQNYMSLPEHQRGTQERSQIILKSEIFLYHCLLTAQDLKSVTVLVVVAVVAAIVVHNAQSIK